MREVGVLEAKTHLSSLLDAVERDGEAVIITRHGRAVARLAPATEDGLPRPRQATGAELAARFKALRESIATANSGVESLTWEELKKMAHE